jgi:hypothetical protein
MELARLLGYFGDAVTFFSGILLSWDAIRSESEFIEAKRIMEGMKHPVMRNVTVKLDQMIVTNENGVERVFRRRASRKARFGTIFLTVGFLLLLGARISEPYHIEVLRRGYHLEIKRHNDRSNAEVDQKPRSER